MPKDSGMYDPLEDEAIREWKEDNPGPYHSEGAYECVPDKPEVSPVQPEGSFTTHPLAHYVMECLHGATTITPHGTHIHRIVNGMPDGKGDAFELTLRIPATDYE